MHNRTEDLLSLLDGEPIDAEVRERALADPRVRREIARLNRIRIQLRALPELAPPSGVWERIEFDTLRPSRRSHRPVRAVAGLLVAAGIAVAAVLWLAGSGSRTADVDAPLVGSGPVASPAAGDLLSTADRYVLLVEESARLEWLLATLPAQRSLMTASTAVTIAGLEDRIAWLDEQLSLAVSRGAAPDVREPLWSERVDMMSALVHLRFAQSYGAGF